MAFHPCCLWLLFKLCRKLLQSLYLIITSALTCKQHLNVFIKAQSAADLNYYIIMCSAAGCVVFPSALSCVFCCPALPCSLSVERFVCTALVLRYVSKGCCPRLTYLSVFSGSAHRNVSFITAFMYGILLRLSVVGSRLSGQTELTSLYSRS